MVIYTSPFGDFPAIPSRIHDILFEYIDKQCAVDGGKKALVSFFLPLVSREKLRFQVRADDSLAFLTYRQLKEHAYHISQYLHNIGFVKQTLCTGISLTH